MNLLLIAFFIMIFWYFIGLLTHFYLEEERDKRLRYG